MLALFSLLSPLAWGAVSQDMINWTAPDLCTHYPPIAKPVLLPRRVMPWVWTQGTPLQDLDREMKFLVDNRRCWNALSPTTWEIEVKPDGTVDFMWLDSKEYQKAFLRTARKEGFDLFPLIGLQPAYGVKEMRQLFANPAKFFRSALEYTIEYKLQGINIDFETFDPFTPKDFQDMKMFLNNFTALMRAVGAEVSMDINSQYDMCDPSVLLNTTVNKFITMDTYAPGFQYFVYGANNAIMNYPPPRIGMGFLACGYQKEELELRLRTVSLLGISEVDIWTSVLPPDWYDYFAMWLAGEI